MFLLGLKLKGIVDRVLNDFVYSLSNNRVEQTVTYCKRLHNVSCCCYPHSTRFVKGNGESSKPGVVNDKLNNLIVQHVQTNHTE